MRVLVLLIMFFAGGTAANACGNPLLWAMLFAKVPEAKIVYEAELSARAGGAQAIARATAVASARLLWNMLRSLLSPSVRRSAALPPPALGPASGGTSVPLDCRALALPAGILVARAL